MRIRLLVAADCNVCLYGIQALVQTTPDFTIVGTTRDGETAVQLAKSLQPDILLLDLDLQSLNGIAVMTRVRYDNPKIRGVFFTERRGGDWEQLALEAGAAAWVSKSIEDDALLNLLRDVHAGRTPPRAGAARLDTAHGGHGGAPLSVREIAVLQHAVHGWTSKEIGAIIGCRPRTVDKHLESIRRKFGVRHPRAIIAMGLVYLRQLELMAQEGRDSGAPRSPAPPAAAPGTGPIPGSPPIAPPDPPA